MNTQTLPKVVRKWAHLTDSDGNWCVGQMDDGRYGWVGIHSGLPDSMTWAANQLSAPVFLCALSERPTWELDDSVISRKEDLTANIPQTPSKCAYATAQIIPNLESETVELWRFQAPEEVQLAPAQDRVLRRAKRMLRDIPVCPGREERVELVAHMKRDFVRGAISDETPHADNVTISAAFLCGHCR
jgi:hypothetical protein